MRKKWFELSIFLFETSKILAELQKIYKISTATVTN